MQFKCGGARARPSRASLVVLALCTISIQISAVKSLVQVDLLEVNSTVLAQNRTIWPERHCEAKNFEANQAKGLPVISSSTNANGEDFFKSSDMIFQYDEHLKELTEREIMHMGLMTLAQSSAYRDIYFHRYDNFDDIKRAAGPDVNNELCLRQLENMLERAERQKLEGYESKDINIYHALDSWGGVPVGVIEGNLFTEGNYGECLGTKLDLDEANKQVDLRYCVLTKQSELWPQVDKHNIMHFKTSVCIPRTCDSLDYKNKFELIGKIESHRLRDLEKGEFKISGLYCLPDEKSEFRSVWRTPKALATLICLISWISLQVYATIKYHKHKSRSAEQAPVESSQMKVFRMLSISNNLRLLFDTSKESSLLESPNKAKEGTETPNQEATQATIKGEKFVDLSCIEGIKVIAMCYVIMGHVLMCMPTIMRNARELAQQGVGSLAFLTANLVPAFAVNSFFAITGLLTSYLMFKQNRSQRVITSPAKWLAVILYRYLRIMPMYALAVLYCKTLAKFASSGPLWDYGTSALSQRRACEQEPWSWTLTFTSNFLPPLKHCIPGGWYLSNDFQFFLVTPFYLALLHLKPRLGRMFLYASIVASYVAGFFSVYNSQVADLRPIANFSPSGFKTYVSHLSFNYTHPQYRISAYLVGLLIGFELFRYEEAHQRHAQLTAANKQSLARTNPGWSNGFKRHGVHLVAFLIIGFSLTPFIGSVLPFNKFAARVAVALVNSSYHPLFATLVGLFILLASTGHINQPLTRFLSAPFWKPFARMSLCAVLVNVEVINYIIQSSTTQIRITNTSHMLLNVLCILSTYLISTVVCVLFEAPVRAGLNEILARLMRRAGQRTKSS